MPRAWDACHPRGENYCAAGLGPAARRTEALRNSTHGACGIVCLRPHDHAGADVYARKQVLDIVVEQADAARGYEGADGRRLVGAVDAVDRLAEIERPRTQRITGTARHEAGQ